MMEVWKFEGKEWNRKIGRYVMRKFWCLKFKGKVWEGFGTKKEALEYAEKLTKEQ